MTLPVSGGVPEPAECELEAIAALLQAAENYRAATWAGPSYANVARWLFDRGVRIQDGAALERPRPALPPDDCSPEYIDTIVAALNDAFSPVVPGAYGLRDSGRLVGALLKRGLRIYPLRGGAALPPQTGNPEGPWRISLTRKAVPDGQWSVWRHPVTDDSGIIHPQLTVANARAAAIVRDALNRSEST